MIKLLTEKMVRNKINHLFQLLDMNVVPKPDKDNEHRRSIISHMLSRAHGD